MNSGLIEFKYSLTSNIENCWRGMNSQPFAYIVGFVRWKNVTTHLFLHRRTTLSVRYQFQIKHSLTSAWVHRPADPVFQCYLAGLSVIFLAYFEVFSAAGCCL